MKKIQTPTTDHSTDSGGTSARNPTSGLNNLISALEVQVVGLSECLVSSGHKLSLGGNEMPGIHYILEGNGRMYFRDHRPIEVAPHTLVIVPPNCPFQLEALVTDSKTVKTSNLKADRGSVPTVTTSVRRFTAGNTEPRTIMICGYFRTFYGASMDLFEMLPSPIVEQFDSSDQLDEKLKSAMDELVKQEIGSGAMSAAFLKQVIVTLVRRSLSSMNLWAERFSILRDSQIARAFADMVAQPGRPHTIHGLAATACLSRSAFMERFMKALGRSPMLVLRDIRMRHAASQLSMGDSSIDQIAHNVGYASRSSFVRAFTQTYGTNPSHYREGENGSGTYYR